VLLEVMLPCGLRRSFAAVSGRGGRNGFDGGGIGSGEQNISFAFLSP
jgi:hypothetical protein